jgi:hypothetical protein
MTYKLTQNKKIKDKLEEIITSLECIDKSLIKSLKVALEAYVKGPDEESSKNALELELGKIMEVVEANKKLLQSQ